ncbi:MAG TPA: M20/M25/M40 family metallo-hydrolase [Ktedonobacterales bacterium]|nr:M20/M25/M40 family metallo-hydrolase [Ktedonobacterales bacterium]
MSGFVPAENDWYATVRDYTLRLVHVRGISPALEEQRVAEEALRILREDGLDTLYTESGLDPIEGDLYGRHNAYAFLRGSSQKTLVLLGHIDTVGTEDYGPLEAIALDPQALAGRLDELARLAPEIVPDLEAHPDDWMFGRGAIDMKCGVAANLAIMRRLAQQSRSGPLPLSIVVLATPDEENESAGVLQGVRFLLRLRERYGLDYLGAINTDYTTALYPGDPHRYIYTGSIGKLLPSFLVVGRESHVGDPFDGADANLLAAELIRDLSMCDDLCDESNGHLTPPPVTLHARDLKTHYDVQLPFQAYFYLNILTYKSDPGELLTRLRHRSEAALARVLQRIDEAQRRWLLANGERERASSVCPRSGAVVTYADLYTDTCQRLGEDRVRDELHTEWDRWPADQDKRERGLHLARRLWALSGRQGPAVVLFYSPPYYPQVSTSVSSLRTAVRAVATAHPELQLVEDEYFPFLSDMSYLRLDAETDTAALVANMPVWLTDDAAQRPGAYALPLDEIRRLNLPVVNLGPYGKGAHQRGERALMSYSFGVLPGLLYETIEQLTALAT